jgi:Holliday junction DNA helicase RuvA
MIYSLTGTILEKSGGKIAVLLDGGLALEVHIPLNTYADMPNKNERVTLFAHLVLREDFAAIYGFAAPGDKELFLKLISVSKIGPKIALAIIGSLGTGEFIRLVTSGDAVKISTVPGIGRKTADRLILELKDKLKAFDTLGTVLPRSNIRDDLISALANLGYKSSECEKAVKDVQSADFKSMLKEALLKLSPTQY